MNETTAAAAPEVVETDELRIDRMFNHLPTIFRDAVDPRCVKCDIGLPWVADGFIYATDGRICVRMPVTEELAALITAAKPERKRAPNPDAVFSPDVRFHDDPTPIPRAVSFVVCEDCGGFGSMVDPTVGFAWECEGCDNRGVTRNYERVQLGPTVEISAHYAGLLRRHDVVAYVPIEVPTRDRPIPIRFIDRTGVVEGRLAPMTEAP